MATPPEILAQVRQAKGQIKQPNMQGTRGGPARGGVAARPSSGGGTTAGSAGAGASISGGLTPEQRVKANANGEPPTINTMALKPKLMSPKVDRGFGPNPPRFPGFKPRMPVDSINGREPGGPMVEPGGGGSMASPKPAWQQIQELGGQGTGTPAGNRALLAKLQAAGGAAGPAVEPGGDAAVSSVPPATGGVMPPPPPGADIGGPMAGGFPGFKQRLPGGMGGLQARPMPATIAAPAGAEPGAPPPDLQIPDESGGAPGGGFGDIARVGAGLMRRPMRSAVL